MNCSFCIKGTTPYGKVRYNKVPHFVERYAFHRRADGYPSLGPPCLQMVPPFTEAQQVLQVVAMLSEYVHEGFSKPSEWARNNPKAAKHHGVGIHHEFYMSAHDTIVHTDFSNKYMDKLKLMPGQHPLTPCYVRLDLERLGGYISTYPVEGHPGDLQRYLQSLIKSLYDGYWGEYFDEQGAHDVNIGGVDSKFV